MENLTFRAWALAQELSFAYAMAKFYETSKPMNFEDKVTNILDDFATLNSYDYTDILVYGNFVITINKKARKLGLLNTRSGKYVETYCNKEDNFNSCVGLGILWAKYNNIERPKFINKKKLSELKPHDVFTISSGSRYEFIGTIKNIGLKNNYVAFSIDTGNTYRFADGAVTVVE